MTQRVIVGLDESEGGRRALAWALRYAKDTDAEIEVITAYRREAAPWAYVAGPVDERGWAIQEQAKAIEQVRDAVAHPPAVQATVTEGDAVTVLCAAARRADLLVLGSHGRGHLAAALLGSVSAGCIHRGTAPVVVVPAHDRTVHPTEVVSAGGAAP